MNLTRLGVLAAALIVAACGPIGSPPLLSPAPAVSVDAARPENQRSPAAPHAERPEGASGFTARNAVKARDWMAVTANPNATEAAAAILARGGSAMDATVAALAMLTLVEPQSSGIGGGAFLLHFDATRGELRAWDGRETAPARADSRLWLDDAGKPLPFVKALVGGRSVGVPGAVRMLEAVHQRHGRLPWAELIAPAVATARNGFAISPRLHTLLQSDPALRDDPAARALYYDADGNAHPPGTLLRNPALADTLQQIARRGSRALHRGPIARDIVRAVHDHASNPGLLTESDLAAYRPIERAPLCRLHASFRLCGMPPPGGGLAVAQTLGLWQQMKAPRRLLQADASPDLQGAHRFAEIGKLVFADRDRYLGDPAFVPTSKPPAVQALLAPHYLRSRAAMIGDRARPTPVPAGKPAALQLLAGTAEPFHAPELEATTHLSIVDIRGNVVSMTASIESAFGARLMVRGFLLNNQLTDFAFSPRQGASAHPNRVQPGKRPRSAMSPTIVFDAVSNRPVLALGSPGGPAIVAYVAHSLIATLDDGIDPHAAVAAANLVNRNGPTEIEAGRWPEAARANLQARGHLLRETPLTSGLHVLAIDCPSRDTPHRSCRLTGAVDPRREGLAIGGSLTP